MRILLFCLSIGCVFPILANTPQGLFKLVSAPNITSDFSQSLQPLCQVAQNTDHYLQAHEDDHFAVHAGELGINQLTLTKVKETLSFLCKTINADQQFKRPSRLLQQDFLSKHFNFYRWYPDIKTARSLAEKSSNPKKSALLNNIPNDQILLTKYYTKLLNGSSVRTAKYNQALYALPYDEKGTTKQQALREKKQLTRFKYTRQQVINGALLKNKLAKPLVWLSEEALHDVLLQGTGVLTVDGKTRYFNVHRNNGIAYDYTKGKREQARYWYFAEVPSIMGYGKNLASKIALKPQVSLAGNVKQFGLGKLFFLTMTVGKEKQSRLAVLADQGGAFDNNFFQLDLLVDSYAGWKDYHQANKQYADYAQAWLMLLK